MITLLSQAESHMASFRPVVQQQNPHTVAVLIKISDICDFIITELFGIAEWDWQFARSRFKPKIQIYRAVSVRFGGLKVYLRAQ